ncbi:MULTISPECIES: mechanosensitive ion channel family protein [unclassified Leucobacter]|uniref:mechanosensitive ion channel family protein n=1 Tax=unclassified Leucobacter TaxID=2621730 RepID=UPI00165E2607|nr:MULTISPECIES: mechanosensitive ion channel family protein [unclassified Leucobacter]MBC9925995.1 mechanosensitive ion channel family protein [Leucobacter sp. cx-169]
MTEPSRKKKVVRVKSAPKAEAPAGSPRAAKTESGGASGAGNGVTWAPTAEAKSQATRLRIFAWVAWVAAIGLEAWAIFGVLRQNPVTMWLLILLIVVIGTLAVTGSLLWKQANRLDPASREDSIRFFVQNQLGAIVTVIAFLPLIILIFLNKDMSGKQKALAGGLGIVVLLVAGFLGTSINPPSVEQYSAESNTIQQLTGEDLVFWTKSGTVFHVCADVPDVNKESQDGTIYSGTVADAHAANKDRLTKRWESEAVKYCGYTQEQVDAVLAGGDTAPTDEGTTPEETPSEAPAE